MLQRLENRVKACRLPQSLNTARADYPLCLQLLTNHGPLTARPVDHIFQKPSRVHKIPAHHENDDD